MSFAFYLFDDLCPEHRWAYCALWDDCPQGNPYLAPPWLEAWLITDQSAQAYAWAVWEEQGAWQICLPLCVVNNALGAFLWPMAADTNDVSDPLALPTCTEAMWQGWAEGLSRLLKNYRALWLPLLSEPMACLLRERIQAKSIALLRRRTEALAMPLSEEGVSDLYSSKALKRLRYVQRQWDELGEWRVAVCAVEVFEEKNVLASMVDLETALGSKNERPGLFTRPGAQEFYRQALPAMMMEGMAQVWCLWLEGGVVAYQILLRQGEDWCLHGTAYDLQWARHSPGRFLQWRVGQALAGQGAKRFAFMQGAHEYKLRLAQERAWWWDLCCFPRSASGVGSYGFFQCMRFSIWLMSSCKKLLSPFKR